MENDQFYSIGLDLIESDKQLGLRTVDIPNDMITMRPEKDDKKTEYTADGRPKDVFSIIYKPDPKYPNPDTTGNGVATSAESNIPEYFSSYLRSILESFNMIKSRAKNILDVVPSGDKLGVAKIIFKNLALANRTILAHYDYHNMQPIKDSKNPMIKLMLDFFKGINNINVSKPNQLKANVLIIEKYKSKYAEDNIHALSGIQHATNQDQQNLISDIWGDKYEQCVSQIEEFARIMYKFCINYDLDKIIYKLDNDIQKFLMNLKDSDESYEDRATIITFMVDTAKNIETIVINVASDYSFINKECVPKKRISIINDGIISLIEKKNPWISSDYHLLKEIITNGGKDLSMTESIIKMHNSVVKPNDIFFFLGDLSESEYDKGISKALKEKLINICKSLNGKKVMMIGNNDTLPDSFYKECGFLEIYHNPIFTEHHLFSHGPIPTCGILNVHGHIHGTKSYWGMDFYNHFDVYHGLWGGPIKLSYIDKVSTQEAYYKGCKSDMSKPSDPESLKTPGNYII